jgi:N-methylhydantoinase B/oxoprolinase/acetone carboxylase alpha subunit
MPRRAARVDPIRLEVFHHLLSAVCEEAGGLLQRTAVSPNIRERLDFSFALFDGQRRLIAQAAHIPVHLGSAAGAVDAAAAAFPLERGDVVVLNDPYAGGTHLPDVTMVRPLFLAKGRAPDFFVVNRAHHADIGGAVPGSMGVAEDLFGEGLVLPPVKLRSRGEANRALLAVLGANVRGAAERLLDLQAQEASLRLAEQRLRALAREHGLATVKAYAGHLMDYAERIAREVIAGVPAGRWRARERMEDDGTGAGPFTLRLELITGKRWVFDFRGTDRQARGGINANPGIVRAACVYALRCLCPERLPTNDGLFRVLDIVTERGSLVDPIRPAPVAGGNVETSQRLVDLCLGALARALPGRIPAASAGTMSNLSLGARGGGQEFTFYETLPGGAGGGPHGPGTSGVQTHMTNTRNTPIEDLELRLPVRVRAFTLRRGSGGAGRARGGDGVRKELEVLVAATVSLFAERHREGPSGRRGGEPGRPGRARLRRGGRARKVGAKTTLALEPGDVFAVETPGGGGWGRLEA